MKRIFPFFAAACMFFAVSCVEKDSQTDQNQGNSENLVEFVPELPADNSSEGIRKAVLLTDFTGNGCPGCPMLLQALDKVLSDKILASKVVLTAAHQFNADDPAYFSDKTLYESLGLEQFPSLAIDLNELHSVGVTDPTNLKTWINDASNIAPEAGICASVAVKDDVLYVNAQVKALKDNMFRVGAWLIEDGIIAPQSGTSDEKYFTHNACLRVADSKVGKKFYGVRLGDIKKDATASHLFKIQLDSKWKQENCRVVVFVAAKDAKGGYPVTNALVTKSLNDKVSYK